MTTPRDTHKPSAPTAADIAQREAERDGRIDDRDDAQRLLGDPPGWRCAVKTNTK